MKVNDLIINNYYINVDNGLCIYKGTQYYRDKLYYVFEYAKNEQLMLSEELVNEGIRKYDVPEGRKLKLNKLRDNKSWLKTKTDAENKAREQAQQLIKLYAERKNIKGFRFSKDTEEQLKFEENFEYELTSGQVKAIAEIKADMESDKCMNRLLNADTGFGKSEVCFRVAFKSVMDGKQVVILLPSNILAMQQYESLLKRLVDFPNIKVGLLNGSVTNKNKKELLENIKNGDVDIIVATHGILSDKVEFNDLGLVITDEAHKFGVVQKEKLKKIKNNVDMLYMTATSTPRETYMAITGIIDVSTIDTPPLNKKPIETKVVSSDDIEYIKERIEFELNRDGQCYILFNDTNGLENKKEEILDLMKDSNLEINIGIIHGKLKPKEIDEVMNNFKNRKYNILLATTIIEVGMNIKSCNSIIIYNSENLGLAQLHQLRNRVSRGNIQGYCALVCDKNLSGIAIKRLKAMEEHCELGSGEVLAKIDMKIRGSGTVIGVQQSGHISKVGLDLYNEILENEIKRQKEELDTQNDDSNFTLAC